MITSSLSLARHSPPRRTGPPDYDIAVPPKLAAGRGPGSRTSTPIRSGAMPNRELVVLGTASQAPTRHRNHNGYLLRWDGAGILFDPGEGTQRQFLLAGVSPASITAVCVTHFHGDHCLGLPGILQRLSLDRVTRPIPVFFPTSGRQYFDRLRHASVYRDDVDVQAMPVSADGTVWTGPSFAIVAHQLEHEPQTFGWRLEEPAGRRV